jgi:hypothetical protein
MDSSRADRAAARRVAGLPGQVVQLGEGKGIMYSGLSYEERMVALWRVSQRAWIAAGRVMPSASARADLPGEVFQLER